MSAKGADKASSSKKKECDKKGALNGGAKKGKEGGSNVVREKNWTGGEHDVLVDSCIEKIDIIDSNLTAEITKEVKNKVWEEIQTAVNGYV